MDQDIDCGRWAMEMSLIAQAHLFQEERIRRYASQREYSDIEPELLTLAAWNHSVAEHIIAAVAYVNASPKNVSIY